MSVLRVRHVCVCVCDGPGDMTKLPGLSLTDGMQAAEATAVYCGSSCKCAVAQMESAPSAVCG